ncbi:MAG: hypothetical protein ACD_5C00017G0001 [uncultured bacterium]|nr:MAG: hypothetical protein ACD_5C00017G0001 [uncultured bacterium]KKP67662.1 MAG: hypothetical protein UR66_C0012G0026 [Candidatus Moranbacteria bacterium GW2011_GWE1_35_17]KKP82729.1 MAG: hypothetical protein UR83_C0047G0008 [Candidatus Moranbacteria bacterium GW2011_GWF2_35_54]
MYIKRQVEKTVVELLKKYPAVALVGPRQSGKSTMAKNILKNYPYYSLEDLDEREFAISDPRGYLERFKNGGIIDEIQKVPELISYLQSFLDNKKNKKPIILTGSAQLTLLSNITQTLSGRVAIVELLPLSYLEIKKMAVAPKSLEQLFYTGLYPKLYKEKINPTDWYYDYTKTYLERDVRDILKVHNLGTFQKFLKMCAARAGQILNFSSLANDCGIAHSTAEAWLNILQATYIVNRVQPHYQNFSKRLIKAPKLYFYDTGLLCFLLGIVSADEIKVHSLRGAIMENWVAMEIIKSQSNKHRPINIFFWRDNKGIEIDFIIEQGEKLFPIEVKSGKTINSDYFKNIAYWLKLAKNKAKKGSIIYAGTENQIRTEFEIYGWKFIDKLIKDITISK